MTHGRSDVCSEYARHGLPRDDMLVVGGWYENEAVQEVKWAIDSLAKTGG